MFNEKKVLMLSLIGIFLVFALGIVSAAQFSSTSSGYSSSTYQYRPSYNTLYSSSQINTYWPILGGNKETCEARQDVLLQVSPLGCQPLVVRSDLLAEQNVPVFCQIDALEI